MAHELVGAAQAARVQHPRRRRRRRRCRASRRAPGRRRASPRPPRGGRRCGSRRARAGRRRSPWSAAGPGGRSRRRRSRSGSRSTAPRPARARRPRRPARRGPAAAPGSPERRRGPRRGRRAGWPWTKRSALPSMIGTSGPSMSISTWVTPVPASAAIRCSTVPTDTPAALVSIVQSRVSLTRSQRAGIRLSRSVTSTRRKRMPPVVAGCRRMRAGRPEWSPVPTSVVSRLSVVCIARSPRRLRSPRDCRHSFDRQSRDAVMSSQIKVYDRL